MAFPAIDLPEGTNIVTWIYSKDQNTLDGDDKARVRNVKFTPPAVEPPPAPTPTPTPTPTPPASSGGGGSLSWLGLTMFGLLFFRRR